MFWLMVEGEVWNNFDYNRSFKSYYWFDFYDASYNLIECQQMMPTIKVLLFANLCSNFDLFEPAFYELFMLLVFHEQTLNCL